MTKPRPLVERFWPKVVKAGDDECWIWTGAKIQGYGIIGREWPKRGNHFAHRASYEIHIGPIPEGMTIDHLCFRKDCVNPRHLEPISAVENARRGREHHGTHEYKTHCTNGHEFTPTTTYTHTDAQGYAHRRCRTCRNAATDRWKERNPEKTSTYFRRKKKAERLTPGGDFSSPP